MRIFFDQLGAQTYQACYISQANGHIMNKIFSLRGILQVNNISYHDRQATHHEELFFYCQAPPSVPAHQDLALVTNDYGLLKLVLVYNYATNTTYPPALRHNCYKAISCPGFHCDTELAPLAHN